MENGQHNRIQFNNLSILPNAEMGDPAYQAKYGMVTVESKIINIHGERVELDDDVPEVQDLVIATSATPLADWRRTRIFCWMTALLHFDKLFQIPLILAHGISGISYRDMIEAFMVADPARFPLIAGINAFFESEARSIQQGGSEYVFSKEYLNIYWPADEYIFVKLTAEGKFDAFYAEAGKLLAETLDGAPRSLPMDVIDEAMQAEPRAGQPAFRHGRTSRSSCATTCWATGTRCATASRRCCARCRCWSRSTALGKPLRRLPEVVPRDRLVGQQEGRLSLFADRQRDHPRARRPLLTCS